MKMKKYSENKLKMIAKIQLFFNYCFITNFSKYPTILHVLYILCFLHKHNLYSVYKNTTLVTISVILSAYETKTYRLNPVLPSFPNSLQLRFSFLLMLSVSLSLSLPFSRLHTHSLSLSLSLLHTISHSPSLSPFEQKQIKCRFP